MLNKALSKILKREVDLISRFENSEQLPYSYCDIEDKITITVEKNGNQFVIKTDEITILKTTSKYMNFNDKRVVLKDQLIKITSSQLNKIYGNPIPRNRNNGNFITYTINEFTSENFSHDENFYRLIIPNPKSSIRLCDYFSNLINVNNGCTNGIEFSINNKEILLYLLGDYLIIESLERIDYKEFDKVSRITLASFGFITGYAPMDYGYFFVYDNFDNKFKGFKFSSIFIGTYDSKYSIINLNASDYFPKKEDNDLKLEKKIEESKKDLNPITKEMFSKLCHEMLHDDDFAEVIFLLLEVNNKTNNNSLYSIGVMYSVILEKITNIISKLPKQNQDKKNEGANIKKLKRHLQKELQTYAKDFCSNHKGLDYCLIQKRINDIHKPTNRDKLSQPFEILDISLTEQEIDMLDKRNDFLHGRNFLSGKEFIEHQNYLLYIGL